MTTLNELVPLDALIDKLIKEERPFYLALMARRCIDGLQSLADRRDEVDMKALKELRSVTEYALTSERMSNGGAPPMDSTESKAADVR